MNIFESNLNPYNILFKTRNQAVDSVFYDVSSLTFEEWLQLTPWVDKKGKIIVVSPGGPVSHDGKPSVIRHYESPDEFLLSDDWRSVVAIAVAGVGSSVVGTAALARSVADACHGDVAGIVSGYGVSDVVLEGLGGWFFYGKLDQFRYEMQTALEDVSAIVSSNFAKGTDVKKYLRKYFDSPLDAYVPSNPDVSALHDILLERYQHENTNLRLLVGHSKGNLLISSVLNHMSYSLRDARKSGDPFQNLAVVTLGSVVDIPNDMILESNQYQFLGTLDALGRMNSRTIGGDIARKTPIPGVWHSLNTKLPGHMDVKKLLEEKVIPHLITPSAARGASPVADERRNRVAAAFKAMANSN
jgi:hypothetical protein